MIKRSRVRVPAEAAGEFCSPWLTLCADSYFAICLTPILQQKHVKDPGHSAKSAGAGYSQSHMHPRYVASNKVTL